MASVVLKDLKYTKSHEWAKVKGNKATFGITDYKQAVLGDVDSVEIPELGLSVDAGSIFAYTASCVATIGFYSPVAGTVVEVNELLAQSPGLLNSSPYEQGWIVKVEMSAAGDAEMLMDSDQYIKFCEEEDAKP